MGLLVQQDGAQMADAASQRTDGSSAALTPVHKRLQHHASVNNRANKHLQF